MYENPRLLINSSNPPEAGSVVWRSPSSIAIIKYWGKYGIQLPKNPSLSLTLASSFTDTQLEYEFKDEAHGGAIDLDFFFHQQPNEAFQAKTQAFLESLTPVFPFLKQLRLTIRTGNSFPHSAGIASSASAMSALAPLFAGRHLVRHFEDRPNTTARPPSWHGSAVVRPAAPFSPMPPFGAKRASFPALPMNMQYRWAT